MAAAFLGDFGIGLLAVGFAGRTGRVTTELGATLLLLGCVATVLLRHSRRGSPAGQELRGMARRVGLRV